ncbi:BREX system ATP-binding domain-containing protein [Ferrimicrobium acidiphilum]|uniref:BREX system ATP-binding domain-containing protein n=1 Tax=Ferrimicrobium acidiphilum TaxID=121039 RepID=UPI0023EFF5D2|nr:BREX system ATP-binding domain-containing protein [Ferrimicrobium acidiphilum]
MIDTDRYCDFLQTHYFRSYIPEGGAAVKFCIGEPTSLGRIEASLGEMARQAGMVSVTIDAAKTKVQMIDQLFSAIARTLDWDQLARTTVNRVCHSLGYGVPAENQRISLAELAQHYGYDARELLRDVNRGFQSDIFKDYAMVQEFRIAMIRLCQFEFKTGQVTDAEADAIRAWLQGELSQISLLRNTRIFRRITRANARSMLFSLVQWLIKNGYSGLLLTLDLQQFFLPRFRDATDLSLRYTKAAIVDAYESLRQLIDNTDEFGHMATIVCLPPEFVSDRTRGLDLYQALKLRIYDEIRDETRDNPFGALIRLGEAHEEFSTFSTVNGDVS